MVNTNGTNAATPCQYRLPCGYCERLMRDCPKIPWTYEPTWSANPYTVKMTMCQADESCDDTNGEVFYGNETAEF